MKKLLLILLVTFLLIGCTNSDFKNEQVTNHESDENEKINEYVNTIGNVLFYIHKLKDEDFTSIYGVGEDTKIWYTAAEELGQIGKPAIPFLIKNLDTKNDYERALTLYALLLSSQHQNLKEITNGEYIKVNLDFNPKTHEEYIKIAKSWWEKYKNNWE